MTIEEMIKHFHITPSPDDNNKIRIFNKPSKEEFEMIVAAKPEILAYFAQKRDEKRRRVEERRKRIESIPGLVEIEKAMDELADWKYNLEASFEFDENHEGYGGMGVGPKPQYNIKEMLEKYPIAALYLKLKKDADKENFEISQIGKEHMEMLLNDIDSWQTVAEKYEAANKAFVDKHMWD
ncbi:MAG: hypothetical protein UDB11_00815 [Peptococcaceae bacterium]|nr:hypothetical protein [Peptococcaceae bacterium]